MKKELTSFEVEQILNIWNNSGIKITEITLNHNSLLLENHKSKSKKFKYHYYKLHNGVYKLINELPVDLFGYDEIGNYYEEPEDMLSLI